MRAELGTPGDKLGRPVTAAMSRTDGTVKEPAHDAGGPQAAATGVVRDGNVLGPPQDR
jgi:hypothetical protein